MSSTQQTVSYICNIISINTDKSTIIFHTRNRSNYNFTTATTIQSTERIIVETTIETISNLSNDSSKIVMLDFYVKLLNYLL